MRKYTLTLISSRVLSMTLYIHNIHPHLVTNVQTLPPIRPPHYSPVHPPWLFRTPSSFTLAAPPLVHPIHPSQSLLFATGVIMFSIETLRTGPGLPLENWGTTEGGDVPSDVPVIAWRALNHHPGIHHGVRQGCFPNGIACGARVGFLTKDAG